MNYCILDNKLPRDGIYSRARREVTRLDISIPPSLLSLPVPFLERVFRHPTTMSQKSAKVIAKDIRNFFGPPGGQKAKPKSSGLLELTDQKPSDRMDVDPEDDIQPRRASGLKRRKAILSSDDDDVVEVKPPPAKKKVTARASPKPRKSTTVTYIPSDDDDTKPPPTKKIAASKPRKSTAATSKSKDTDDYADVELVVKPSKTTTKPSVTHPAKQGDAEDPPKKKPNWYAMKAAKVAGPSAPGSKQVPEPASEDCLAGLCFVFTGELSSFSRDEAIEIAKRFGG